MKITTVERNEKSVSVFVDVDGVEVEVCFAEDGEVFGGVDIGDETDACSVCGLIHYDNEVCDFQTVWKDAIETAKKEIDRLGEPPDEQANNNRRSDVCQSCGTLVTKSGTARWCRVCGWYSPGPVSKQREKKQ